jgi:magnesium-transporting ATPase (P-type)
VGNLVVLTKGDRIPVNLRVINGVERSVNESLLTAM